MADPVLERDIQVMDDLGYDVARGDKAAERQLTAMVCKLAGTMTKWQWVIHGETVEFRKVIVRWLCNKGEYVLARRFALCGRGDLGMIEYGGDAVKVVPMGCGCRFCPRCSRRFGARFLRKVGKHLEANSHGEIWHVVLTQRVQRSETLIEARERFGKAWKRFYPKLRAMGMASALCTYHVTASVTGGWHYHCHLVIEWVEGTKLEARGAELTGAWKKAKADSGDKQTEVFGRKVCEAGGPLTRAEIAGQGELWAESVDPVAVALQYVVRDVLQGVEKWVSKINNIEDASTFAEALSSAKLHRLYGAWRRKLPKPDGEQEAPSPAPTDGSKEKGGCGKEKIAWITIGRMDEVLWWARGGNEQAVQCVRMLLLRFSNKGMVSKRLKSLAPACCR